MQQFLQESFLNMWEVIAKTLGDLEAVIGFEVRLLDIAHLIVPLTHRR